MGEESSLPLCPISWYRRWLRFWTWQVPRTHPTLIRWLWPLVPPLFAWRRPRDPRRLTAASWSTAPLSSSTGSDIFDWGSLCSRAFQMICPSPWVRWLSKAGSGTVGMMAVNEDFWYLQGLETVNLCLWVRLCRVKARDWISRGRRPSSSHSHAGNGAHIAGEEETHSPGWLADLRRPEFSIFFKVSCL